MKNLNAIKFSLRVLSFCLILLSCKEQVEVKEAPLMTQIQKHPSLILTAKGVNAIKSKLGNVPIFDESLAITKKEVDVEIELGIEVPVPKDMAGGYTHSRHKRNFIMLQKAGLLFQILDDEKYAVYVRDMLMEYAKMYPNLPLHPQERSYARGKIFWQCLNDANWLVYTSQAYDCIYDWLTATERQTLEKDLFIPFANFLSEGSPQFFNRVHNHSTWGNVAVGMISLVMGNDELLERALYGIKNDSLEVGTKDNDGGFIKVVGQKSGFFANLDEPFSPDGYYTEGPYYQRYAMYPFLVFAEALHHVKPELKIFEYKDGVLLKSVNALLNLTDADGEFFPINDAQKGMSYYSRELVSAVDIAYHFGGNEPSLLSIAALQNRVQLDDSGLAVAEGLKNGSEQPFVKKSIELRDGAEGNQGGIGVLRAENLELVFKYAAQGLSHGHYDKLSFSFYDDGKEVIQDYGLARFVNIEQKNGGGYLKENKTWAKQTIAHNTIVQNETSHFKGKYELGSKHHGERYLFATEKETVQVASAKENNAYPGTQLHRTMALIKDAGNDETFVLDILRVIGDKSNTYDLPFYYLGQPLQASFEYESESILKPMGSSYGYQHLFKEASGIMKDSNNMKFNWMLNNKFYTLTSATSSGDEVILGRIGANDPEFNLRRDPVLIIRKNNQKEAVFVSVIESHGNYSPVSEFSLNAYSKIKSIAIVHDDALYTVIKIINKKNLGRLFLLANKDNSRSKEHIVTINNKEYHWTGPYHNVSLKNE